MKFLFDEIYIAYIYTSEYLYFVLKYYLTKLSLTWMYQQNMMTAKSVNNFRYNKTLMSSTSARPKLRWKFVGYIYYEGR